MKLVTIVADSVAEALAEVNRQLGPNAVIVNVRKMGSPGLSRIWKKPQIEVQATVPSQPSPPPQPPATPQPTSLEPKTARRVSKKRNRPEKPVGLDSGIRKRPVFDKEVVENKQLISERFSSQAPDILKAYQAATGKKKSAEPNLAQMLENLGLLPLHVQWLTDQLRESKLTRKFESLKEEFAAIQEFLVSYWNRLAPVTKSPENATRILLGTPGVGKTTCLCKWLTHEVLLENRTARVWRLDGDCANTADFLSIHGEILGVPVERVWTRESYEQPGAELQFIDLPGMSAHDLPGIARLKHYQEDFKPAKFYLVLNAAYDLTHLLDHVKAYSVLPLAGLILSHLDEDRRWGKFWNLLLGTRLPVIYLSADQNIPGIFCKASPTSLFDISGNQWLGVQSEDG